MAILGINDSHDSGAALFGGGRIIAAVNEERFTKRKNEVGFPYNSVRYLSETCDEPAEAVALGWIGGNALVSRVFPRHDEIRRQIWRRERPKPSRPAMHLSNFIYKLVQNQRPAALWQMAGTAISRSITERRIMHASGKFSGKKVYVLEHHLAHAASAYYTSGFKEALVITLDGAGDGLSGTVSIGDKGELTRLASFKASASLGLLYGAATAACDLRFSEDEGKLMSLAAYSYPHQIKELGGICAYDAKKKNFVSRHGTRNELLLAEYLRDHVLSGCDRESFAYAVQRHAEEQTIKLIGQWIKETGIHNVAVAGGFFSNVIGNRAFERLPGVKDYFVFPQMGDGGLSVGAAAYVDFLLNGRFNPKRMASLYLGPSYSDVEIALALKKAKKAGMKAHYEKVKDPARYGAELVAEKNRIILWFQGRMEYGPRALGNRSVIAMPNDPESRNRINLIIKKRPYYQPFASTILEESARELLSDYLSPNPFMTSANGVAEEHYGDLVAASHVDHTTRPQTLGRENLLYRELITRVRKESGIGAVLNTSLNKHGKPIVMEPSDAIWTLENTGADTLIIGNYLVEKAKK